MEKRERAQLWRTSIGLQDVDNLRVSNFLIETARKHIEGDISMDEVSRLIDEHYKKK
ncbi:antitoxin VbhA family protein [Bacteroides fragilis]